MNYLNDLYFKTSFKIANKVLESKMSILSNYALMVVKPETMLFQKLNILLNLIYANDFIIIYCKKENINSAQTMTLWEPSWDNTTIERILLNQKLFELSNSLVLILKYVGSKKCIASEYLTFLKGSSNKEIRSKDSFREKLQSPNFLINFIHTSDDIENFIREIGIFFSCDKLLNIYNLILNDYNKGNIEQSRNICELFNNIINNTNKSNNSIDFDCDERFYVFLNNIKEKIHAEDKYINQLLSKAYKNKRISNELLWKLIKNGVIEWDIDSLSILTLYTNY